MPLSPLTLPGAEIALDDAWLDGVDAGALREALVRELPWHVHVIRLFGREVPSPRLSCWIGDPDAVYGYSGTRHSPHPWHTALQALRMRLRSELDVDFNSVLANLYRDRTDHMGWHCDDEPELGDLIASISLGAPRQFQFRPRPKGPIVLDLTLAPGSLLIMTRPVQQRYQHRIPATRKPVGARINLTLRQVMASSRASVAP